MKTRLGAALTLIALVSLLVVQLVVILGNLEFAAYYQYLGVTVMYLMLSGLIWVEIANLNELHIDGFTLSVFVLSTVLRRRLAISGEGFFLAIIGLSGVATITAVLVRKPFIPRARVSWAIIGTLAGVLLIVPIYLEQWLTQLFHLQIMHLAVSAPQTNNANLILTAVRTLIYQLSFVVPAEELLFRGFLWGYLRRRGLDEVRACWIQGALFWALHWPKLLQPLDFVVGMGLITWSLSVLTLRSKQLAPSVLAHLVVNTVLSVL